MQSADKKILVPIDDDDSSLKAVSYAVNRALQFIQESKTVAFILVNLYSSWDVGGNQEREGKLSMDQAQSFAESSGVRNCHI